MERSIRPIYHPNFNQIKQTDPEILNSKYKPSGIGLIQTQLRPYKGSTNGVQVPCPFQPFKSFETSHTGTARQQYKPYGATIQAIQETLAQTRTKPHRQAQTHQSHRNGEAYKPSGSAETRTHRPVPHLSLPKEPTTAIHKRSAQPSTR
jgi:hypothetical protein